MLELDSNDLLTVNKLFQIHGKELSSTVVASLSTPTNPQRIELSEQEVEDMLDVLPIPQESSEAEKNLRLKLTSFLQQLRKTAQ